MSVHPASGATLASISLGLRVTFIATRVSINRVQPEMLARPALAVILASISQGLLETGAGYTDSR